MRERISPMQLDESNRVSRPNGRRIDVPRTDACRHNAKRYACGTSITEQRALRRFVGVPGQSHGSTIGAAALSTEATPE
jgi:hypothetical protein